ncbi:hypothetical protein N7466_009779 [Penicillium verhagenii]|uniref:uncharacterized protein n=1 Tax=Penicillium verhagenii TaxID=1562060 RepID=UPI00254553ED|nr:uncharacterized protein N7466_009779 [Penicillium verhagenii]KAJ5921453.1 hypothetical protein N7466_009779 [Penicillium verhagenii]
MTLFKSSCKLRFDSCRLYWNETDWLSCGFAADIIFYHYKLRAAVQRVEYLEGREKHEIRNYSEELENARQEIGLNERELYWCETRMRSTGIGVPYALLRQNPGWYLRSELIEDCKGSGGCCGRSCGCCKKRQSSKWKKAAGHCTADCSCCATHRQAAFNQWQKDRILNRFREMLQASEHSNEYLCKMTIGYFAEFDIPRLQPKTGEPTKQEQSDDETFCDNETLCGESENGSDCKEETSSIPESNASSTGWRRLLRRKG